MKIINDTVTRYSARVTKGKERFRIVLPPQSTVDVPTDVIDELRKNKRWERRLAKDGDAYRVVQHRGAAGAVDAKVRALRSEKRELARAKEEERAAKERMKRHEARIQALEAEAASEARESSKSKKDDDDKGEGGKKKG